MRSSAGRLPTLALLALALSPRTGAACSDTERTFAVLASGRVLHVESVGREPGKVRLALQGGGELLIADAMLARIETEAIERVAKPLPAKPAERRAGDGGAGIPEHPWRDEMTRVASSFSLEAELVYAIARVESGLDPAARSPKGALGLMQLMPDTAKLVGVTDPLDPVQSIEGGCRYFRQMLDRFGGDVSLALAAYNAGPGTVEDVGRRVPDIRETKDYVARVLETARKVRS